MENYSIFFREPLREKLKKCKKTVCILLMLLTSTQLIFANSIQNAKVSIHVENVYLSDLLWELQESSGVVFAYKTSDLKDLDVVSAKFEDAQITEILDEVLKNTDLEYKLDNEVVVLVKKPETKAAEKAQPEKMKVKGVVTDSDGFPLPGVSVVVQGSTIGVATNFNGEYEILLEKKKEVLLFSFVGMLSQSIAWNGQEKIDIVLKNDSESLAEVVINGYLPISKERATGSYKKVDAEDINRTSNSNLANTLEGMAPGILVSNDNNGEDLKITIRGASTFEADKQPLIVVDGFPIDGTLNSVNPDNIETMTILQDAAAASIYGVKAANGVIVITTKAGKEEKAVIEFTTNLTIQMKPSISYLQLMDSKTAVDLELDYYEAGHIDPSTYTADRVSSQVVQLIRDGVTDRNDPRFEALRNQNGRKQFDEHLLDKGIEKNYGLSVRGRQKNYSYAISGKIFDKKSIWKGDAFKRINIDFSNQLELTDKLSADFGVSAHINRQQYNSPRLGPVLDSYSGTYTTQKLRPYDLLVDEEGNRLVQNASYNQKEKERLVALGYPYNWDYNLIDEMENQDIESRTFDTRFRAGANYKLLKGMNVSSKFQYERSQYQRVNDRNEKTYYTRNLINETTLVEEDGSVNVQLPLGGIYDQTKSTSETFNFRTQVDFDRTFGDHRVTALVGNEVLRKVNKGNFLRKYGYNPRTLTASTAMDWPALESINQFNGESTRIVNSDYFFETEDRFVSFYGNFAYTFMEKYSLTGSIRQDQSNLFGVDAEFRKNPLWSMGSSWNISKENFFQSDWVNNLKLRFTFGFNGNIDPASSGYMVEKLSNNNDTFFRTQYGYITDPGNPTLRWERTKISNLGLDFSLFNYRLSGSIEYYSKQSKDLFIDATINSTYGFTTQRRNDGEISNRGFDLSLHGLLVNQEELKWNMGLNLSYNKNEVISTNTSADAIVNYIQEYWQPIEGKPLGRMYAYRWAGLSENGDPQIYDETGEVIDHLTSINDPKALKYMGSTDPKYYGSFQTSVSYKGLTLTAMLTFKAGHVFRRPTSNYLSTVFAWGHEEVANRWRKAGDEKHTNVPGINTFGNGSSNTRDLYYANADINVEDASYVRFKELSLSYQLPKDLLANTFVQTVKLKCNVQNLGLLWTASNSGYDPDYIPYRVIGSYSTSAPWYGKHQGLAPRPGFTFGVNVTF